jgi:hypothetical protein
LFRVAISSAPTVEPTIENLPRKRCAPDDDGEDRVELHLVPRARYVDGHDLGDREEPADGRESGGEHVDGDEDGPRADAGEPARVRVDADRLDHEPKAVRRITSEMSTTIAIARTKLSGSPRN